VILAARAWFAWARTRPPWCRPRWRARPACGRRPAFDASGYVTARRQATVSAKITGKVTEVLIEEGMRVREGAVLARLDDTEAQAQLGLTRAQLVAARSQLAEVRAQLVQPSGRERRRELFERQPLAARAQLAAAQAQPSPRPDRHGRIHGSASLRRSWSPAGPDVARAQRVRCAPGYRATSNQAQKRCRRRGEHRQAWGPPGPA
jgi:multidrug resistance efflux pump